MQGYPLCELTFQRPFSLYPDSGTALFTRVGCMLIATEPLGNNRAPLSLSAAIRACYEGRHTQDTLAAASGIPQQTISRLARGEANPRLTQLADIERACDRPVGWILICAGYVADVTTVPEAIAVAPELDDSQRQILLDAYEAMLKRGR